MTENCVKTNRESCLAALLRRPQVIALEIKVDRIDIKIPTDIDIDEVVLWIQILDLPCMQLSPFQRDSLLSASNQSLSSAGVVVEEEVEVKLQFDERPVLIKKAPKLVAGQLKVNKSGSAQSRKGKEKKSDKNSDKKKDSNKKKSKQTNKDTSGKKGDDAGKKVNKHSSSQSEEDRETVDTNVSGSKSNDMKDEAVLREKSQEDAESEQGALPSDKQISRDATKKLKLLSRLLQAEPEAIPEGLAFNSDCCILIPCSAVSNVLYKMDRLPIVIYIVKMNKTCKKLIGKVCYPFDYHFQNAVVKAAKVKGGVITHCVQEKFSVFSPSCNHDDVVGYLFGSIKLICYGSFGWTELKSQSGDLMTGKLHAYKANLRDMSLGLGKVPEDYEHPYGFCPVVTGDSRPAPKKYHCPSLNPISSMFDLVPYFYRPEIISKKPVSID